LLAIVAARPASAVAEFAATTCTGRTAFATAAFTTAAFAARTTVTAFATIAAFAFGPYALFAGEFFKTVYVGFALRPSGLKQVFQIQAYVCGIAHVKKAPSKAGLKTN
jgi:hypothetical protein